MAFTLPDNDEAFNTNQAIWMQTDINALAAGLQGDGVLSGCAVTEDAGGASMNLDVSAGTIQIAGTTYTIAGGAGAVTIGAADPSDPRIDLVCANTSSALTVTAGTAAANPKAPDIPASSVLLAMVYVPAGDTAIANNQITDKRVFPFLGGQLLNNLSLGANELQNFTEQIVAASTGASYDIDWSAATLFELTLTDSPTFTFSNLAAGRAITLVLIQDATGSRIVTWPASVDWAGGTAPTLTTTANAVDVITLFVRNDGATVLGFESALDMQ